jgi:hypothetical protein
MYRKTIVIVTVLVCATLIGAVYLNGQAHRYDIVAVGAGAGGSSNDKGDLDVGAWLIDHRTGQVWVIQGHNYVVPIRRLSDQETFGK